MTDVAAPSDPSAWAGILNAVGALDSRVQWLLFTAFMTWLLCWRGFQWWDTRTAKHARAVEAAEHARIRREDRIREEAKAEAEAARSDDLNGNIGRLCNVLEHHTAEEENNSTNFNHAMVKFQDVLGDMSREMRGMRERINHQMSPGDSITAIGHMLNGGVRADICHIFDKSLRDNNFIARGEFIRVKVKTDIGGVFDEARHNLETGYHLSVDLAPFFPAREGDGGSARHVLCDRLWEAVEPLYLNHGDIEERLGEMRVTIGNILADAVTKGRQEALVIARRETAGI